MAYGRTQSNNRASATALQWHRYCFNVIPATLNASTYRAIFQSIFSCPIRHRLSAIVNSYHAILSSMIILHLFSRPLTVSGPFVLKAFRAFATRIMSIVIYSIQRIFSTRTFSIILNKVFNIMPPFAHTNTSPSIVVVCDMGGLFAPIKDLQPQAVKRVLAQPMRGTSFAYSLPSSAATSLTFFHVRQIPSRYIAFLSAYASTSPIYGTIRLAYKMQYKVIATLLSCAVDKARTIRMLYFHTAQLCHVDGGGVNY